MCEWGWVEEGCDRGFGSVPVRCGLRALLVFDRRRRRGPAAGISGSASPRHLFGNKQTNQQNAPSRPTSSDSSCSTTKSASHLRPAGPAMALAPMPVV